MHSLSRVAAVVTATLFGAACSLTPDNNSANLTSLDAGFATVPVGFNQTQNTFGGSTEGTPTPGLDGFGDHHHGGGPGGGGHGMMCGGPGGDLTGDIGFGPGFGRGPFGDAGLPSACTFAAATGRVTCPPVSDHGLTINRWAKYTDKNGTVQQAFDTATTNTVQSHVDVTGTVVRRDSATSVINHSSDRTVAGLASGSAQRTVNGTSAGSENTTGTSSQGQFTLVRTLGDTTTNLVIPTPTTAGSFPFPTAGTVIRHMKITLTIAGGSAQTSERREVITYDGTNTAKVVITKDGTTQNCTIALPHGRPVCS